MQAVGQLWFLKRSPLQPLQSLVPALAGSIMLSASFLPWLHDPWGMTYSAWQLPLDLGWQIRAGWLNYGLLCAFCALYAFLVAWANWHPIRGVSYLALQHRMAGFFCFLPLFLFALQFICCDSDLLRRLAEHQTQVLLIQQHFGYSVGMPRVRLEPFMLDSSLVRVRLSLFLNLCLSACLLPAFCGWLLIYSCRFFTTPPRSDGLRRPLYRIWLPGLLLLFVLCGRAPLALVCEYQAQQLLVAGDYAGALRWLDATAYLNPEAARTPLYHRERGEALYFLNPGLSDSDSSFYLTEVYRNRGAYAEAYQELLAADAAERGRSPAPWLQDERALVLAELAESAHPLQGSLDNRPAHDARALSWLQLLLEVDPDNIYAQYLAGRIAYEQQSYGVAQMHLLTVARISSDSDIQSSVYTYLALGEAEQGAYQDSRRLLFQAVALDYRFRNNTAREALSGLR